MTLYLSKPLPVELRGSLVFATPAAAQDLGATMQAYGYVVESGGWGGADTLAVFRATLPPAPPAYSVYELVGALVTNGFGVLIERQTEHVVLEGLRFFATKTASAVAAKGGVDGGFAVLGGPKALLVQADALSPPSPPPPGLPKTPPGIPPPVVVIPPIPTKGPPGWVPVALVVGGFVLLVGLLARRVPA